MAVDALSVKSWTWNYYFHTLLVILSSWYNTCVTGEYKVIGASQQVKVLLGDDVSLPCRIEPPVDAYLMTVTWTRPDLQPDLVHLNRDGQRDSAPVNPVYKYRTSMYIDDMKRGNISMKLERARVDESGTYKCTVPQLNSSSDVQRSGFVDLVVVRSLVEVKEEGTPPGEIAAIVIPLIILLLVLGTLAFLFWRKKKQTDRNREPSKDENNMRLMAREDVNIPVTPEPLKWTSVSERWKPQLEKIRNTDDSNVTRVGTLVFVKDPEFCIINSDGIEVFLGLTEEGTEVAIKRMSKINYNAMKNEEELFQRLPKLKDDSIVQYVDSAEDENFGYIALELCEYSLEEYIKNNLSELKKKELAQQVLKSLSLLHGHNPRILHRDIKPQNVFIDVQKKAKLSEFGKSRELPEAHTTHRTSTAGSTCWKAKETLDNAEFPYKRSTDIQVAGMLVYYILSGGHHPFGKGTRCEANILDGNYKLDHVQDVVAKDLIKRMIDEEPKKRPKVEECLAHPYFWSKEKRAEYLRRIGKEVDSRPDDAKDLIMSLDQCAEQGHFNTWKHKFPSDQFPPELLQKMESCPENSVGLLRFIHNLHEHSTEEPNPADGVDLMEMFPALFGWVHQFAKEQDWNSRPGLKNMFRTVSY